MMPSAFKMLIFLHLTSNFVSSSGRVFCPLSEELWLKKSAQSNCSLHEKKTYHCIQSADGGYIEACLQRRYFLNADGCPWLYHVKEADVYILGAPHDKCEDKDCPKSGSSFYSDELYKYPSCIRDKQMMNTQTSEKHMETTTYQGLSRKWVRIGAAKPVNFQVIMRNDYSKSTLSYTILFLALMLTSALQIS